MSFRAKQEEVSVSFHYLKRERVDEDQKPLSVPFTEEEFTEIYKGLEKAVGLNIDEDEEANLRIRNRVQAVIQRVEAFDKRFIAGIYKAAYWGHSFDNSVKGKIPATSINFRPFFFLLYLSESGRIYLASQYLGNYGGYLTIKGSVLSHLKNRQEISANSFSVDGINIDNVVAKEVQVAFSRQSQSITGANLFTNSGAITFKKKSKDDGFEGEVARTLLSQTDKPPAELKKIISKLISNDLMEIQDEDIEDCKVIALVGKKRKRKVIHLFDESSFASRFTMDIGLDQDGHPVYEPLKKAVIETLKAKIIAKKE